MKQARSTGFDWRSGCFSLVGIVILVTIVILAIRTPGGIEKKLHGTRHTLDIGTIEFEYDYMLEPSDKGFGPLASFWLRNTNGSDSLHGYGKVIKIDKKTSTITFRYTSLIGYNKDNPEWKIVKFSYVVVDDNVIITGVKESEFRDSLLFK